jgi:glycosyltransferase involved in cell wall biosynthesis
MVDIIIPAYNPGGYIVDAIESCQKQTFKDFKITVVDDCSKQDLSFILKKYPKVNLIKTPQNMGPAGARNFGILNSDREYISFLDADDIWDINKLFYSLEEFKKDSYIGMTCGNYRILVNRSRLRSPFYKKIPIIDWNSLMKVNLVASGSVTVKRKVIDGVGNFDERFWIAEDYNTWLKISESHRIKYIHKVLYYYSVCPGNKSLTQRDDVQKDHLKNVFLIKKESQERVNVKSAQERSD